MRILFITKRQYTNKDLVDDRYGRLRELPLQLSVLGHQVIGSCLSYKKKREASIEDSTTRGTVIWHSYNAGRIKVFGLVRYFLNSYFLARKFRPDIIFAASDSIYGVIALFLGRLLGKPFVFDMYDNFESFAAIKLPFVQFFYGKAIRHAHLLTVVSKPLKRYIVDTYSRTKPTLVLENGVDPNMFYPISKMEGRDLLNLPKDAKLIGVTGAISHSRGIEIIFPAFAKLVNEFESLYLVLAGKIDKDIRINSSPNIIVLGELPHKVMPLLISALDVSIVSNIDSPFGRFCYPQKFVEAVACGTAPVVAAVGALREMLNEKPEILFLPGNVDDLVRATRYQLLNNFIPKDTSKSWLDLAKRLEQALADQSGEKMDLGIQA